jgi:hypothetical protein
MKKRSRAGIAPLIGFLCLWLFAPMPGCAYELTWSKVTTCTDNSPCTIDGYKFYIGTSSGCYSRIIDVGRRSALLLSPLPHIPPISLR